MRKLMLLILFGLILASYATVVANAQEINPWVSTWDATNANLPRDVFNTGESVRVKAYNDPTKGAYDIILRYPNGSATTIASGLTGYHEAVYPAATMTPALGGYTLFAGSASVGYATALYTVIPEVIFGVLGTFAACFAGFGLKSLRAKKKV